MTTQSIIVYRNPAEAAFWEGGYAIPIGGGLIAGVLVFLALVWIAEKIGRMRRTYRPWGAQTSNTTLAAAGVVAVCAGLLVMNYLLI